MPLASAMGYLTRVSIACRDGRYSLSPRPICFQFAITIVEAAQIFAGAVLAYTMHKESTSMHILFVEDERRLANLLKRVLTEAPHVVAAAYDGAEALHPAPRATSALTVFYTIL